MKLTNQGFEEFMNNASFRHFENLAQARDRVAGLPELKTVFEYALALAGFIAPLRLSEDVLVQHDFKLFLMYEFFLEYYQTVF